MMQSSADAADSIKCTPLALAAGPPGFELLMEPELIAPAEQELDDTATENVVDAAISVVLRVIPFQIMVCAPAAMVCPWYVRVDVEVTGPMTGELVTTN